MSDPTAVLNQIAVSSRVQCQQLLHHQVPQAELHAKSLDIPTWPIFSGNETITKRNDILLPSGYAILLRLRADLVVQEHKMFCQLSHQNRRRKDLLAFVYSIRTWNKDVVCLPYSRDIHFPTLRGE